MEAHIQNLLDVWWWVGQFLPVVVVALAAKAFNYAIRSTKKALRGSKAKKLKVVKSIRRDDLLITREMLKASIPILWAEWLWLTQDSLVKELVTRRARLRVHPSRAV